MLSELAPGSESNEDFQLLQELHKTCRQMQLRLVELLNVVTNEEVTSECLISFLRPCFGKFSLVGSSSAGSNRGK